MLQNALQLCLGPDFERLVPTVRRAHLGRIELSGNVAVARGRGLGGLLAGLLRMPQSHAACPLHVVGEHHAEKMIWRRDFAGRRMESHFRKDGPCLVEKMGSISLRMLPQVQSGRLHYTLMAARVGPIPLPGWLKPSLIAWEGEHDDDYEFEVEVGLPLIGRLIRYAGRLTLKS